MQALEVITGTRRWSVDCADNLDWLKALPDACCSLALTSPPYEDARTYGIGFALAGQSWVDWMAPRVAEACRATAGLVLVNAAGKLKGGSYSPVVEWLVADLTRRHGIVCGPAPYVYFRYGIPGSGGRRYHRRDWEPVYAFCLPDRLPLKWSDNTAMGHPPKWAPGGEMSNRLSNGTRVNQWGRCGGHESGGSRGAHGRRQRKSRPSHEEPSSKAERSAQDLGLFGDATPCPKPPYTVGASLRAKGVKNRADEQYAQTRNHPPAVANPGNVVREKYDAEEVRQLLAQFATREIEHSDVVRCLAGGGQMGSKLAHENEAPFPETLCEFFVRSYAPPDSVVMDFCVGSGTVGAVALRHGRRFVGCDVRQGQVDLASKRLAAETPGLFGGEAV